MIPFSQLCIYMLIYKILNNITLIMCIVNFSITKPFPTDLFQNTNFYSFTLSPNFKHEYRNGRMSDTKNT